MKVTYKLTGMKEVEAALQGMKRPAARAIVRRVSREALEPVARSIRAKVHVDEGTLRESVDVSERLSRAQRTQHVKRSDFEMFVGPGALPQAITEEFGTFDQAAHPSVRPAWDAEAVPTLDRLGAGLGIEVQKAAARAARKAAKG